MEARIERVGLRPDPDDFGQVDAAVGGSTVP